MFTRRWEWIEFSETQNYSQSHIYFLFHLHSLFLSLSLLAASSGKSAVVSDTLAPDWSSPPPLLPGTSSTHPSRVSAARWSWTLINRMCASRVLSPLSILWFISRILIYYFFLLNLLIYIYISLLLSLSLFLSAHHTITVKQEDDDDHQGGKWEKWAESYIFFVLSCYSIFFVSLVRRREKFLIDSSRCWWGLSKLGKQDHLQQYGWSSWSTAERERKGKGGKGEEEEEEDKRASSSSSPVVKLTWSWSAKLLVSQPPLGSWSPSSSSSGSGFGQERKMCFSLSPDDVHVVGRTSSLLSFANTHWKVVLNLKLLLAAGL